jgi:hypothetical protein
MFFQNTQTKPLLDITTQLNEVNITFTPELLYTFQKWESIVRRSHRYNCLPCQPLIYKK